MAVMTDHREDKERFRKAMRNVTPLPARSVPVSRPKPPPRARRHEADERRALEQSRDDPRHPDEFASEPALSWVAPGVQKRAAKRLRRGQISVEGVLDLHGMTLAVAREEFARFLEEARERDLGCVRIIHGKGFRSGPRGPVLKRAVARWLSNRGEVLAYTSARPVDGGTGAVYVLLKR
ncbi:MAG: Smr/MutS family protein [Gammaproteobacteria bacterium]|nr:Smr/MutS family protein [Gammaproteobacteria bacterium]